MDYYDNPNMSIFIKFLKLITIFIIVYLNRYNLQKNIIIKNEHLINLDYINKYNVSNLQKKYFIFDNDSDIFFKISDVNYCFSFKYGISKLEYYIGFYENNTLIYPSDIALYKNLEIVCNIYIINEKLNYYIIDSFPNIYSNKYFKCIEFFNYNYTLKFGIKIYQKILYRDEFKLKISLFNGKELNYKNLNLINDSIFDPLIINQQYENILKDLHDINKSQTMKLKKSYIKAPICKPKNDLGYHLRWTVKNLYNHYFYICIGIFCSNLGMVQKEKYYFYLNVIDNNKYVYNKTDYLLADFIFTDLSFDDTYPIFQEMEKRNLSVHYVTEDKKIYNKYCYQDEKCLKIIPMNKRSYIRFGDFLEKYLTLLLKLKAVISGKESSFSKYSELFYNLDYVTYIAIGHGVCYFKDFLYDENRIYGIKSNDRILIPPTDKIINFAKKFGWKDENIIKLNLPRWDKFNNYNEKDLNSNKINNNSIFVMFTWRDLLTRKISQYYFDNIILLLENKLLNEELKLNNITLYFSYHRFLTKMFSYRTKHYINKYKNIKIIEQNKISKVLTRTNLVVTDFSSIVFDMIYRRKPFVIYLPDANAPDIKELYKPDYYHLINSMKNGTFQFENVYLNIKEAIYKIIFYVHNKFHLEKKLEDFYDSFSFNKGNNIDKFINYLNSE